MKEPAPSHDPDYFSEQLSITVFDATGQLRRRLQADFLQHFPDDDTTELRVIRLALFPNHKN